MLENVKVLAVGANTTAAQAAARPRLEDGAAPAAAAQTSGVLTFEVTRRTEALQIIAANSGSSKIYLVLLPPTTTRRPRAAAAKTAASK